MALASGSRRPWPLTSFTWQSNIHIYESSLLCRSTTSSVPATWECCPLQEGGIEQLCDVPCSFCLWPFAPKDNRTWPRPSRYLPTAACFTRVRPLPPTSDPSLVVSQHVVQGVTPRKPANDSHDGGKASGASNAKRITTPHACAECKRRKM